MRKIVDPINYREAYMPRPKSKLEPPIDNLVSKVIGKKVLATDPRLLRTVAKWKAQKGNNDMVDNFLQDPKKVEELKKVFNASL